MAIYKCGECDGSLDLLENGLGKCQYCGALQTLPKDNDERISQILNRANDFRKVCDFDRAIFEYEKVLELDETEPEAHWGIFLSRYGVEYVKDTMSLAYKPTLHRISSVSVFDDVDYQATLKYASPIAKEQYISKAALIEQVMKNFLITSANEEPYDIFISYKELDDVTRLRTDDSYLAHDLYNVLTAEGYKVFFAPKSLVGVKHFEPKIYSAIISSKAMVVLGTKPQYLEGVWVKNEWSRFAELIEKGEDKIIIPVFKNMEANQLPNRFASYQAYNWDDISFIEDVKKVLSQWVKKESKIEFDKNTSAEAAFIERGFIALEDREFQKADSFFENALNLNPHSSQAYFGKLMVEMGVSKQNQIVTSSKYLNEYKNFEKAVRFADQQQKTVLLQYEEKVQQTLDEQAYNKADSLLNKENPTESDYNEAAYIFNSISNFKDSKEKENLCYEKIEGIKKDNILQSGIDKEQSVVGDKKEKYREAIEIYKTIPGWKDADERLAKCKKYIKDIELAEKKEQKRWTIKNYFIKPIAGLVCIAFVFSLIFNGCQSHLAERFSMLGLVFLKADGTVLPIGSGQSGIYEWTDIVTVSTGGNHTVGLKSDGTVVAVGGNDYGECNVSNWSDIIAISAGNHHTVGLKSDGTVVATAYLGEEWLYNGQCNVWSWTDIVSISAGARHTVGLKSDGTVVATEYIDNDDAEYNDYVGQCDVSDWTDIIAISADNSHTVGLKSDGTVVAAGSNGAGQCNVEGWTDIVAVYTGGSHTVGLRSNGTVVGVGSNNYGQCQLTNWEDIVDITAGSHYTVGLKSNGEIICTALGIEYYCDDYKDANIIDLGEIKSTGFNATVL